MGKKKPVTITVKNPHLICNLDFSRIRPTTFSVVLIFDTLHSKDSGCDCKIGHRSEICWQEAATEDAQYSHEPDSKHLRGPYTEAIGKKIIE